MAFEQTAIPRHKSWGGPLVIARGKKRGTGDKSCPRCGRPCKTGKCAETRRGTAPQPGDCHCLYYKRTTNFVDVLQSEYALKQYDRRMVAYGMSQRPDLVLSIAALRDPDGADKDALQGYADDAKDAAKAAAGANIGTALHRLTEDMDHGRTLGHVPDPYPADLKAYEQATKGIEWVGIESFRVCDQFKVAGTADRIGYHPLTKRLHIFDLKGLALDTPIPTPDGWTTMGAIRPGNQVFDEQGNPCFVTAKSSVKRIGTYRVSFDDGSSIVCDSEHIWWTQTQADRYAKRAPQPRNILDIIATQKYWRQNQHTIPVAKPLNLMDADLPIDPYVLGAWLGDGSRADGRISKSHDLFDIIESDGHQLGIRHTDSRNGVISCTVIGLKAQLRRADILGHKQIPEKYLRASHQQRLRLLQGLMDTDGTWNTARRRAVFNSTDKALAHQVHELMLTLGQRANLSEYSATGFGKKVTAYAVEFLPVGIAPFRLPRKVEKAASQEPVNPTKAQRRVITSIEPGPDVETACIAVDSPSHLYLCGTQFIPTHNTSPKENPISYPHGPAMQLAMYAHSTPYDIPTDTRVKDVGRVDLNTGYIISLPAGKGRCEIRPINIGAGWGACLIAVQVWRWREDKNLILDDGQVPVGPTYSDLAAKATTEDELRALWARAKQMCALTDDVKADIISRREELQSKAAS